MSATRYGFKRVVKGAFFNYVDKILAFLTTSPMYVDIFYLIRVDKKSTYPPHLSNVGKKCPLPYKILGGKLEGGRHVKSADENFKLCTKLAIYGRKCQHTYTAQTWFSNKLSSRN